MKKILGQKNYWGKKNFGCKKIFGPKNFNRKKSSPKIFDIMWELEFEISCNSVD